MAPEKSREINLRRFVPLDDIDPLYFERVYFLIPEEGAQKAYRLLAAAMQDTGRAGIATFVMRGKEYLVAIISERGILRAETLRFQNEVRTPEDIGAPQLPKADKKQVERFKKVIADLSADAVNEKELVDEKAHNLQTLVESKLTEGEDVKHPPNLPQQESAQVIDLMQVLKRSLEQKPGVDAPKRKSKKKPYCGRSRIRRKPKRVPNIRRPQKSHKWRSMKMRAKTIYISSPPNSRFPAAVACPRPS